MDSLDVTELLGEHLQRNPAAQRAALHDPQAAADLHRLRVLLGHLDRALAAEGLDGKARHRIAARVVADSLGSDEATARLREHATAQMPGRLTAADLAGLQ
ncbi:hypothetical protein ACFY0G_32405 [Streptomyces sp. NPDC001552]|uniref:hypothetical protein n=1 Tax=Streptomyces sp. NPDC001552 TaxID=3364587 RepID=UPI0036BABB4F